LEYCLIFYPPTKKPIPEPVTQSLLVRLKWLAQPDIRQNILQATAACSAALKTMLLDVFLSSAACLTRAIHEILFLVMTGGELRGKAFYQF